MLPYFWTKHLYFCCKKTNSFQYSFVRIFRFVLLSSVQQYSGSSGVIEGAQGILLLKIHLPTTVTQCWIPQMKSSNWNDFF